MTADEVAQELRLPSVKTLYAWRYRKIGPPAARIGRHLRYRRSDVDAWAKAKRQVTTDDPR